jgi:hypothetical protein
MKNGPVLPGGAVGNAFVSGGSPVTSGMKNGPLPPGAGPVGNAGPPVGANANPHMSWWWNDHVRFHDRFFHRRFHRHLFAFGFGSWYNNYDPSCYEYRLVHTNYGMQWIRVWLCG